MDWTFLAIVALGIFVISNSILDYFTNKELKEIRSKLLDINNKVDSLDRRCIQDLNLTDQKYNFIKDKVLGIEDNLKYEYLKSDAVYCMYDMQSTRFFALEDSVKGYYNILSRLEPLAPLADKFDIKRKLKYNKAYADDLKYDLKEVERELKELA